MLTDKQLKLLQADIDPDIVEQNRDGFLHLEGYVAIDQANEIFGFDGWSYEVTDIGQQTSERGDILFYADVRVSVFFGDRLITRQDTGTQPVASKPGESSAKTMENARKAAVTDALKRALRSFGNQFGNSLYDKDSAANAAMKQAKKSGPVRPAARPVSNEPSVPCEKAGCPNLIVARNSKVSGLQPAAKVAELSKARYGQALCRDHMIEAEQAL